MRRTKKQKTFVKVKEKLVFIPPQKFLARKFLGIIFLIIGSTILAFSAIYFYLIPQFFSSDKTDKKEIIVEKEKPLTFLPKEILIPGTQWDFLLSRGLVEGEVPLDLPNVVAGKRMVVLGGKEYKEFKIVKAYTSTATAAASLSLEGKRLKLILVTSRLPAKNIIIEAEEIESSEQKEN